MSTLRFEPESIETFAIADLKPYERNARKHPSWQLDQIAASIKKFGFTVPILIAPDKTIIAGHGRVEAAKMLGLEYVRAIIVNSSWSHDDIAAYVLADNKIALNAEWDDNLLRVEISDLDVRGFDLSVLGFNDAELARLLNPDAPDVDPHEAWQGMPEFDQSDMMAFRTIKVHFHNQDAVNSFAALLGRNITDKTKFIWFPDAEVESCTELEYVT